MGLRDEGEANRKLHESARGWWEEGALLEEEEGAVGSEREEKE